MLVWLLDYFGSPGSTADAGAETSHTQLTARIALAVATSFLAALILGPLAIRWLRARFRERIASASEKLNQLHAGKGDTPTMGGVFIVAAIVAAVLLWGDLTAPYVQIGLFIAVAFGTLGAADDWIKLRTTRRGLSVRQKLLAQLMLSLITAGWLYVVQRDRPFGTDLCWPLGDAAWPLGAAFILWGAVVLVGSSNGVNLTDGLDGLAGGCIVFAGAAFVGLSYLAGHSIMAEYLRIPFMSGSGELAILIGAMVGAVLGFLWYNCHPAQVFMGDAGSLPLGALLGYAALVTRQEVLLVIIGGIFVVETLSVIVQVFWYRRTGRRVLACSPLHNHFLFRGHDEHKLVVRFWITAALLAVVGIACLRLR